MPLQRTRQHVSSNAEHAEMTDCSARDAAAQPSTARPADTVQRWGPGSAMGARPSPLSLTLRMRACAQRGSDDADSPG
jgi:hypothetical protein